MADITYCSCVECLNTECERHAINLRKLDKTQFVSIANFGGVCREYIHQVLIDVERGDNK